MRTASVQVIGISLFHITLDLSDLAITANPLKNSVDVKHDCRCTCGKKPGFWPGFFCLIRVDHRPVGRF